MSASNLIQICGLYEHSRFAIFNVPQQKLAARTIDDAVFQSLKLRFTLAVWHSLHMLRVVHCFARNSTRQLRARIWVPQNKPVAHRIEVETLIANEIERHTNSLSQKLHQLRHKPKGEISHGQDPSLGKYGQRRTSALSSKDGTGGAA